MMTQYPSVAEITALFTTNLIDRTEARTLLSQHGILLAETLDTSEGGPLTSTITETVTSAHSIPTENAMPVQHVPTPEAVATKHAPSWHKVSPLGLVSRMMKRAGTLPSERASLRVGDIRKVARLALPLEGGFPALEPETQFQCVQWLEIRDENKREKRCMVIKVDGKDVTFVAKACAIATHTTLIERHKIYRKARVQQ